MELEILGLFWDLRRVWGGVKIVEGLRRVAGAILVLLDQTLVVGLSSSAEEGGGRSPYNPPSILKLRTKPEDSDNIKTLRFGLGVNRTEQNAETTLRLSAATTKSTTVATARLFLLHHFMLEVYDFD